MSIEVYMCGSSHLTYEGVGRKISSENLIWFDYGRLCRIPKFLSFVVSCVLKVSLRLEILTRTLPFRTMPVMAL